MKKIVLSLAGVLAATAFAPEASAVPAFARQVGMACTACHSQHFPVLNSFGRSFKAAGFTMMGSQGKVEGDHMSLPDTLNASIVMKIRYQDDNRPGPTTAGNAGLQNVGGGQWQFFDEFALLFGGRVAENVGFLLEAQMIDTAPLMASFKMPFTFDMGGAKLSAIPFQTDGLGAQYGYELSSGGVVRNVRWAEHGPETSALMYNATTGVNKGAASGIALVAQNDMGFINLTKWAAGQLNSGGVDLDSNYIRIAATPTWNDWAMVVGLGRMSGSSFSTVNAAPTTVAIVGATTVVTPAVAGATVDTDQTFFDFQAQGEVAGKELAVYFQHAKAPATVNKNAYNTGAIGNPDRKATTIGADYSVIPHVLTIGAAYRNADTGGAAATNGDDAWTITGVYDLYQNVAFHLNYSNYSGSAHNAVNALKNKTTVMLEAAW